MWMNLKTIMLKEGSKTQGHILYEALEQVQLIYSEKIAIVGFCWEWSLTEKERLWASWGGGNILSILIGLNGHIRDHSYMGAFTCPNSSNLKPEDSLYTNYTWIKEGLKKWSKWPKTLSKFGFRCFRAWLDFILFSFKLFAAWRIVLEKVFT